MIFLWFPAPQMWIWRSYLYMRIAIIMSTDHNPFALVVFPYSLSVSLIVSAIIRGISCSYTHYKRDRIQLYNEETEKTALGHHRLSSHNKQIKTKTIQIHRQRAQVKLGSPTGSTIVSLCWNRTCTMIVEPTGSTPLFVTHHLAWNMVLIARYTSLQPQMSRRKGTFKG